MANDKRQLLVVDDSEIDRIILKSMLSAEFTIQEATNGSMAIEFITRISDQLDAVLLDISMPHITGFDVLQFMRDKGMNELPVFLITSEPTRENVERALMYNVEEFICKPFFKDDVLRRLHSRLGVIPEFDPQKEDLSETRAFISSLQDVYQRYLVNFGKKDDRYRVMQDLMHILLTRYSRTKHGKGLDNNRIDLISRAAYFCDIGEMLLPDKRIQLMEGQAASLTETQQSHTVLGANLVRLNQAKTCAYFVEICSGMCLHHHERYDGTGYPDGIRGKNNSIFNQLCRLVDDFEEKRSKFYGNSMRPVKFIIKRLLSDDPGMVSQEVLDLLEDCEPNILDYFSKSYS